MSAFTLPSELEAHEPPEARGLRRDEVRLLVTPRTGAFAHARFRDLPDFLRPGDCVVLNTSGTLPAALEARRADGTAVALHLSTRLHAALWVVEPRKLAARRGETLALPDGARCTLLVPHHGSARLWVAEVVLPEAVAPYLARWGRAIRYPYVPRDWPLEMYQTVYATEPGSAEMPSAGRGFTPELLARLGAGGVRVVGLTLHTGVASLERDEPPYEEHFEVPAPTADAVNAARAAGGRVIAVGTSAVRALESALDARGRVVAARGWTDLVITPGAPPRAVDGLITGFHEPRATHLAMLRAVAGEDLVDRAYAAALGEAYLWHEFGDLHLIV